MGKRYQWWVSRCFGMMRAKRVAERRMAHVGRDGFGKVHPTLRRPTKLNEKERFAMQDAGKAAIDALCARLGTVRMV